jgi:hypothetical protein
VRVLGCDSLALAVCAASPAPSPHRWLPVLDARRDRFVRTAWRHEGRGLRRLADTTTRTLAELTTDLAHGDRVLATPAVAARLADVVRDAGAELVPFPTCEASTLFAAALPLQPYASAELQPTYTMGSYAADGRSEPA